MAKVDTNNYNKLTLDALYALVCKTVREMTAAIDLHNHRKFKQKREDLRIIRSVIKEKQKIEKTNSLLWCNAVA